MYLASFCLVCVILLLFAVCNFTLLSYYVSYYTLFINAFIYMLQKYLLGILYICLQQLPWHVLVSNTAKWPWALLLFSTFLALRPCLWGFLCHWKRRGEISGTFLSTLGPSWYWYHLAVGSCGIVATLRVFQNKRIWAELAMPWNVWPATSAGKYIVHIVFTEDPDFWRFISHFYFFIYIKRLP